MKADALRLQPDRVTSRVCLACGKMLEPTFGMLGSLRCLDCRDLHAQLDPRIVAASQSDESWLYVAAR